MGTKKVLSFKDFIAVDYTNGSWNDSTGQMAYQFRRRHFTTPEESYTSPLRRSNPVRVEARQKRRAFREQK